MTGHYLGLSYEELDSANKFSCHIHTGHFTTGESSRVIPAGKCTTNSMDNSWKSSGSFANRQAHPFDPTQLKVALQNAIEGKLGECGSNLCSLPSPRPTSDRSPASRRRIGSRVRAMRTADAASTIGSTQSAECRSCAIAHARSFAGMGIREAPLRSRYRRGHGRATTRKAPHREGHTMTLAQARKW